MAQHTLVPRSGDGGSQSDEELLEDFKHLISEVANRVTHEAVGPTIDASTRKLDQTGVRVGSELKQAVANVKTLNDDLIARFERFEARLKAVLDDTDATALGALFREQVNTLRGLPPLFEAVHADLLKEADKVARTAEAAQKVSTTSVGRVQEAIDRLSREVERLRSDHAEHRTSVARQLNPVPKLQGEMLDLQQLQKHSLGEVAREVRVVLIVTICVGLALLLAIVTV